MNSSYNEDQDLISTLPDDIIGHILSFLSTEVAVRTCVLSKRWIYLWKFITRLSFQDKNHNYHGNTDNSPFMNYVYYILSCLNKSRIQSFSLTISRNYNRSLVNECVSIVLRRGVKRLYVNSTDVTSFPSLNLENFQSLEELELMVQYYRIIRISSSTGLSSLTVLKLSGIAFLPDNDDCEVFGTNLKFPLLKVFETTDCNWSRFKVVTFEVPLIQVVSIQYHDLQRFKMSNTKLKFCASRLKEFTFIGPIIFSYSFLFELSAIKVVSLIIHPSPIQVVGGILASEILKQFNGVVECLKIQSFCMDFSPLKDSFSSLSSFEKLSHLELHNIPTKISLGLFSKTPFLKTLIFKSLLPFNAELLNFAPVPDCFPSNLQVVEFGSFDGYEYELSFAKFIIENAQVLQKIKFRTSSDQSNWKLEDIREKLFSFRKASSAAIIDFSIGTSDSLCAVLRNLSI